MSQPSTVERHLRTALHEAAAQVRVGAVRREPLGEPMDQPRARRNSTRLLVVCAGALVLATAIGSLLLRPTDRNPSRRGSVATHPVEVLPTSLLPVEADVAIFMRVNASEAQIEAVRSRIRQSADVRKYTFVDQEAAFEEFSEVFRDQPDLVNTTDPDALPVQFRLIARTCAGRVDLAATFRSTVSTDPNVDPTGIDAVVPYDALTHEAAKRYGHQPSGETSVPGNLERRCRSGVE